MKNDTKRKTAHCCLWKNYYFSFLQSSSSLVDAMQMDLKKKLKEIYPEVSLRIFEFKNLAYDIYKYI
jgi:hypothetical protein